MVVMTPRSKVPLVILGAGLAGSSVALECARRGHKVLLLDQDCSPMNRASLRNEGKIHLGFVYAQDSSFATSRLMLDGALSFQRLLERWVGPGAHSLGLSTPFTYLVPHGSLLTPDDIEGFFGYIQDYYLEVTKSDPYASYFGRRPGNLSQRCALGELEPYIEPSTIAGAFRTEEIAIDPSKLRLLIWQAIKEHPLIEFLPSHRVESVSENGGTFVIECACPEGVRTVQADQLVNCLWENRLLVDRMVGIATPSDLLHRLKYRVIAKLPEHLQGGPSVTMVVGRYGDVVIRPDRTVFLSWYPAGLQGWTGDIAPPISWNTACKGEDTPGRRDEVAHAILAGIDPWYPGMGACTPQLVDAGVIVAYGHTDVDDANSGLHDRSRVGVNSKGGYFSIESGKLTLIPMFAMQAADQIVGEKSRL